MSYRIGMYVLSPFFKNCFFRRSFLVFPFFLVIFQQNVVQVVVVVANSPILLFFSWNRKPWGLAATIPAGLQPPFPTGDHIGI